MSNKRASKSEAVIHPPCGNLHPLSEARVGAMVKVKQLTVPPETAQRLREMGFCEEKAIRLVHHHGNFICQVRQMRMGISRQVAARIWVEPMAQTAPSE